MRSRTSNTAFTVVELVVVIAVVSVVVALAIPLVASTRGGAERLVSQSNLRQCAVTISLYADDYGGSLPYLATRPSFHSAFEGPKHPMSYLRQESWWPMVLLDRLGPNPVEVLAGPWVTRSVRDVVIQPGDVVTSGYLMAWGSFYRDSVWTIDRPLGAAKQSAYMSNRRIDEVVSPSGKGLLIESAAQNPDGAQIEPGTKTHRLNDEQGSDKLFGVAYFDASTGAVRPQDFELGRFLFDTPRLSRPMPVLETAGGLGGVDR